MLTKWGYEVTVTRDGAEAWEVLQGAEAPPVAILDWMMPGLDGVEVCRKVRQRGQEPYIYLLLLTTKGRKENIIEGLDAGADDYLTKPFDPHELQVRLRTGMRIVTLQAEIIEAREALRIQATHDALTGVWNRRAILDMLGTELVRSSRDALPVAVAMVDLDHFKRINDTYGHVVGDVVLRESVSRMRALLRPYDALGRYGGEEFLVVLPGCSAQDAFRLAERLRLGISQEPMVIPEGTVDVTSSLGVATNDTATPLDATALIQAADTALYRAKAGGRNRVEVATPTDLTSHTASSKIWLYT
jgi:diguanylate cyclase (GGDEF)-like protein